MQTFLDLPVPIFMPDATLGAVKTLTSQQVLSTDTKMVVVNTLHLLTTVGPERMRKLGGIKKFMSWPGKVLTDSGGFQVYSLIHQNPKLGKITQYGAYFNSPKDGTKTELTPESSIDMQAAIASDVFIALDDCRHSSVTRKDAEKAVETTVAWAQRAKKRFDELIEQKEIDVSTKVFAVVQGGNFKDLREKCLNSLVDIGFDGYCFGGWPVDNEGRLAVDILRYVADIMPDNKPKYAMGVGKPQDIKDCFDVGYDIFDCVIPTRNARHGTLYTKDGVLHVVHRSYAEDETPIDSSCDCYTCSNYTRAYLHHLLRNKEQSGRALATIHNLRFYQEVVKNLRSE